MRDNQPESVISGVLPALNYSGRPGKLPERHKRLCCVLSAASQPITAAAAQQQRSSTSPIAQLDRPLN
jgi:hypothetical protein